MKNQVENPSSILETLIAGYGLKLLKRSGWIQSGLSEEQVETVAAHSWGMAYLFNVLEDIFPNNINKYRALKMAVMHDLAEAKVGDITPADNIPAPEKQLLERDAFQELSAQFSQGGADLMAIWEEFEAGRTPEAQLIKRLDKLDMLIQATIYEQTTGINLDSFWQGMDSLFISTELEPIYDQIQMKHHKSKGK